MPRLKLLCVVGLIGVALTLGVKYLAPLVAPFLVGLVLACLVEPVIACLERVLHLSRWLASGIVLALSLVLLGGLTVFMCIHLWSGLRNLLQDAIPFSERLSLFAAKIVSDSSGLGMPDSIREALMLAVRSLPEKLTGFLNPLLAGLGHLPSWFLALFLGMLAAYYFSRDLGALGRALTALVPAEWSGRASMMRNEMASALMGFLRAQCLLFAVTTVLGMMGFALLGINSPIALGILLGLIDLMPLVGPGMILLPWSGIAAACGDWGRFFGLIALFVLQAVFRQVAEARFVGRNLGLHPLAALAAIYAGLRLFGLFGFFVGPIILVFLRALYRALSLTDQSPKGVMHEANLNSGVHRIYRASSS